MGELSLLLGFSSWACVLSPPASFRARVASKSCRAFLPAAICLRLVFDVGLQGSRLWVGFPLHFAGYVFPLLFNNEAEEGAIGAGSP